MQPKAASEGDEILKIEPLWMVFKLNIQVLRLKLCYFNNLIFNLHFKLLSFTFYFVFISLRDLNSIKLNGLSYIQTCKAICSSKLKDVKIVGVTSKQVSI